MVEIFRNKKHKSAYFKNVHTCKGVWKCPVCSARISVLRAFEIEKIYKQAMKNNNYVIMLTFTTSHTRNQTLKELVEKQNKALIKMFEHWSLKEIMKRAGYIGRITSFESTYGNKSGWHPHRHVLMFFKEKTSLIELYAKMLELWQEQTKKQGLETNSQYCLKLSKCNQDVSKYVSKIHLELALSDWKQGKTTGRLGAFALLYLYSDTGAFWCADKFQEFCATMRGKSQLRYSKGLRAYYNIEIKTDEEIITDTMKDEKKYMEMRAYLFRTKLVKNDVLGEFLALCIDDDKDYIRKVLGNDDFFFVIDDDKKNL